MTFFYVPLDVNYPENHKRIRAGLEATGLHTLTMCLAKRSRRDGWVARDTLSLYGGTDELVDRLLSLGLLDEDGEWVRPHDWLEVNLSSQGIRAEKTDKARAANHARWHDGPYADCEKCKQKARSSAVDPPGLQMDPSEVDLISDPEPEAQATDPAGRRSLLEAAANIIGNRAAARPSTQNPDATRRAVAAGVIKGRHQDAYAIIAADSSITPDELAEALEPTQPAKVEQPNPSSRLPRVADLNLPKLTDDELSRYEFHVIEGEAS